MAEVYRMYTSRGLLILTERAIILEATGLFNRGHVTVPLTSITSTETHYRFPDRMQLIFHTNNGMLLNIHSAPRTEAETFMTFLEMGQS